jgi:alanyl-tRNA synthetase
VGEGLAGVRYHDSATTDKSLRIVADHSRAVTFMIGDGILPSNEGRGYVLRRLLRRAVYHGRLMGIKGQFLTTYAHEVTRLLGDTYPELVEQQALIDGIINAEEERFGATLDNGEEQLKAELSRLGEGEPLSGDVAFTLHDTYGFPIDLTREIAGAAGHSVDMDAFDAAMEAQRERARATANRDAWGKANNVWVALSDSLPRPSSTATTTTSSPAARSWPSCATASRSRRPRRATRSSLCSTARRSTARWAARWATPASLAPRASPTRCTMRAASWVTWPRSPMAPSLWATA